MSRSRRHSPVCGWTTCRSEAYDKLLDHRQQRHRARRLILHERYDEAEVNDRGIDVWLRGKDGKQHWWVCDPIYQGAYSRSAAEIALSHELEMRK